MDDTRENDVPNPYDSNEAAGADSGANDPPADPGPTREEVEALRKQQEQLGQTLLAMASAPYTSNAAAQRPVPDDDEIDASRLVSTDDEGRVNLDAKSLKKLIAQTASEASERTKRELMQAYTSNRAEDNRRFATIMRERIRTELESIGLGNLLPDVQKYIQENQISDEWLARDGAYEVIAKTVLGEKALDAQRTRARRAPALGSSSGSEGAVGGEDVPRFTDSDLDYVRRRGIDLDSREAEFLLDRGTTREGLSFAEYKRWKDAQKTARPN